ncbi:S-adenosyl-L-methionine-dependent methyltransferase [Podospora fimiseda]|uniref:catechol O-methyltransferase n=1 Tax=Podospora fimiseda TaxID=252190 RepID=A0AAN7BNT8_9PEZI|nr:S-adenosyl-L-methionine-dependent methyltransferase [Podospora fimiseda]
MAVYLGWKVNGESTGAGREVALLEYIYDRPDLEQLRGNPRKVLDAIDNFAQTKVGLINVGNSKGGIVCGVMAEHKPSVMLELGGYMGFSAIMFGNALRENGGSKYYSVEKNPLFAAIAANLIDLAGLGDVVRVVVGTGAEGIQRLYDEGVFEGRPIDMAFFDHHKPAYKTDLKLCERLGLIDKGTVLVADNMIIPGNPAYAEYVRATVAEKREKDKVAEEKGNANLVYKSRSVNGFEPSGGEDAVEITECLGVEA